MAYVLGLCGTLSWLRWWHSVRWDSLSLVVVRDIILWRCWSVVLTFVWLTLLVLGVAVGSVYVSLRLLVLTALLAVSSAVCRTAPPSLCMPFGYLRWSR